MQEKIIVGTRGSALALKQTNMVIDILKKKLENVEFEIKIITTTGDRIQDRSLDKIGGKGLFVLEIEKALRDKDIDIAVHSMKDIPAFVDSDFEISPLLKREDPRDILISKDNVKFADLPKNAVIGTSSLRRVMQLRNLRSDLIYLPVRGNIDSRIKKLETGEFQGIILAAAGLNRMGWSSRVTEYFNIDQVIPSVGQGALCIEYRTNDMVIKNIIHEQNRNNEIRGIMAERSFLEAVNGSCSIAMGAFGEIIGEELSLKGFYSEDPEGRLIVKTVKGKAKDYQLLGQSLAFELKK
ncbi:hydroxymethylbilane synthase [Clostridium vincentii]|uniref:Porphobilinogen deaminase n=1 Tax=Clostridium vincentii TaxID=52704 RepID=A0A2T0BEF3_9CLOT|nr:hydroxymethylbilane synthase [Clostridium vincentii]PRR82212.1 Porphobilinogen deaminase [Clostridium vincentii]